MKGGVIINGFVGAGALEHGGPTWPFATVTVAMAVCWGGLAIVRRHEPAGRSQRE